MNSYELSILELGVLEHGSTSTTSMQGLLKRAQLCDQLGYSRYWIAEHHEGNSLYCSPEVLIGWLAGKTQRIKIGSAGMLLRYRDSYFVGQAFNLLSSLYPDRIDLGIARGKIGGPVKELFAAQDTSSEMLDAKCAALAQMFQNYPHSFLRPRGPKPEIWLMGGRNSGQIAAINKMKFCLDSFFQLPGDSEIRQAFDDYAGTFRARNPLGRPQCAVAIAGICAETNELAQSYLAESAATGFPVDWVKPSIVGTPDQWRQYLSEKAEKCGTRSFVILTATLDVEARQRSLELLAEMVETLKPALARFKHA
jgi:luciferase family oxidoreductase group 1